MRLTDARCIRFGDAPMLRMLCKGTKVSVKVETLVLFGATGDLAQRMLFPSLYNLHLDGLLAGELTIIRSEEHTSELQSLMRISYAVFCLKKKKQIAIADKSKK